MNCTQEEPRGAVTGEKAILQRKLKQEILLTWHQQYEVSNLESKIRSTTNHTSRVFSLWDWQCLSEHWCIRDQPYVQWPVIREQFFSVWDRDHQFFSENRYKKDSWLQIKEMFIDQWYKLSFSDQNTFQRPTIEEEFSSVQRLHNWYKTSFWAQDKACWQRTHPG